MTMDTKKLKDPGFPLPKDGKQTSDLMSRLQVFLPQLQAANQGAHASSMIHSVWKRWYGWETNNITYDPPLTRFRFFFF
jgi:hypothetical protein